MNKEFLKKLLEAKSPSGVEKEAINVWDSEMESIGLKHYYKDPIGNSGWSLGEGATKVLLSGHLDEVAMAVVKVDDDGYLGIANMAGIDKKCLPGSKVQVLSELGKWIPGIIQKAPIHVEEDRDKAEKLESLVLDLGCESKSEVSELAIYPGCPIVHERNINLEFGQHRLYGNALDDKIGVFITAEVARIMVSKATPELLEKYTFIFLATTQEESGLRGAAVAAENIKPNISIDIDVTFATNGGLVSSSKYGEVKLGSGPVIEFGQDKDRDTSIHLIQLASQLGISVQRGFARCGGTNTDEIQLNGGYCRTNLISIPNMSMHTPNETCDWRDVEGAIKLISGYFTNSL